MDPKLYRYEERTWTWTSSAFLDDEESSCQKVLEKASKFLV